jgi:hypothetical protein
MVFNSAAGSTVLCLYGLQLRLIQNALEQPLVSVIPIDPLDDTSLSRLLVPVLYYMVRLLVLSSLSDMARSHHSTSVPHKLVDLNRLR